jgi:hypothetical protein
MKITKRQLRRIIKEEILREQPDAQPPGKDVEFEYERGRWDAIDGHDRAKNAGIDYDAGYDAGVEEELGRDREMYGV